MKAFLRFALLVLAPLWNGCDNRPEPSAATPLAPSPTQVTAFTDRNPPLAGERWNLTTTLVSIEGSACFWRATVGTRIDWLLAVQREETRLSLLYDVNNWPTDHLLHVGTVSGQTFTAVAEPYPGRQPCAEYVFSADVSGSFSPDGLTLSARERWIYQLTNGSEIIVTLEWKGTRQ